MRIAVIILAIILYSCRSSESATQVMVRISARDAALDADDVRVRVLGGPTKSELSEQRVVDVSAAAGWPVEIAIEPKGGDASRMWRVEAWALSGTDELGAGSAEGGFTAGKLVEVSFVLKPGTDLGKVPELTSDDDGGTDSPSEGDGGGSGGSHGSAGDGGPGSGSDGGDLLPRTDSAVPGKSPVEAVLQA